MNIIEKIKHFFKKHIGSKPETSKEHTPSNFRETTNNEKKIVPKSYVDTEAEEKRNAEEKAERKRIHTLYNENFREYLIEVQKFRDVFGKNVKCDVCDNWESDLFNYRGQTYCENHIPVSSQMEHERKITAGRHGAARDFIKK